MIGIQRVLGHDSSHPYQGVPSSRFTKLSGSSYRCKIRDHVHII